MDLLSREHKTRIPCPVHWWSERHPQRAAIYRLGKKPIRYVTLDKKIRQMQQVLAGHKLAQGDRLLVVSGNSFRLIILFWACWRQGITLVPVNPRFSQAQLEQISHNVQPSAWWAADTGVSLPGPRLDMEGARTRVQDAPQIQLESIADLILTSGSTGTPKAVAHQFSQHLALARASQHSLPLGPGKSWLLSLPLFHIGGVATLVRCMLTGAAVHLPRDQSQLPELVKEQKLTHVSLVPTQLLRLLQQGEADILRTKTAILLGGAPLTQPLKDACLQHGLPVYVSYGLTEMSSQVCTSRLSPLQPLNRVGWPLPGVELKIVDQAIWLRGPTRCAGYLVDGELQPQEEWLITSDRGELDAEGQLLMLGRADNMFISGGENIHPEALEQVLLQHPEVSNAVIVPVEDDQWGQRPVAFVDGLVSDYDELASWYRQQTSGYQQPVAWLPMPEEFMIANPAAQLKVSRGRLKQIAAQTFSARASQSSTSGSR